MQLKQTTDYAIRFIWYLAEQGNGRLVTGGEISSAVGITPKYLQRVAQILRRAGLVESAQGISGGFRLAKAPREITILDVIIASEEKVKLNRCLESPEGCNIGRTDVCLVHQSLDRLQSMCEDYLKQIAFSDLL